MSTARKRPYVGLAIFGRDVFVSDETPTFYNCAGLYAAVIGPFRTKRGAQFMARHGQNNPHCRTVADAERLAKTYAYH
jgi:hypothetical protein